MATKTAKREEQQEAIERLREWLKPGDTVYTVMKKRSSSGMYRHISAYKLEVREREFYDPATGKHVGTGEYEAEPMWLAFNIAKAIGWPFKDDTESVGVSGVGMDMGFHLVYTLSHVLYPDGFDCVGRNCPSNEHSNGDRDYSPHRHQSGGYALKQRWLS